MFDFGIFFSLWVSSRSKKERRVGPKINALVRKTNKWLGKCKIRMSDKRGTEVRKEFGYSGENRSFVPCNLARRLDQRYECAQRLGYCKERMLQKLCRIWPLLGIDLKCLCKVVPER